MIRISHGKPRVVQAEGRWGEAEPYWYVPKAGWVTLDMWLKLLWYESPVIPTLLYRMEEQIRERLKLSGMTMVWEFEALTMDLSDRMRMTALLGERSLSPWTWSDYWLRRPLLQSWCWLRNLAARHYQNA
jgi:hypothetical protein